MSTNTVIPETSSEDEALLYIAKIKEDLQYNLEQAQASPICYYSESDDEEYAED